MDVHLDRRTFLRTSAGITLAGVTDLWTERPRALGAEQVDEDLGTRVDSVLRAYDAQGIHRTGTDVDRTSGEWLRGEAERAGGRARLESFPVKRLDVQDAFVEMDGQRIAGLPFFDGGTTDAAGVSGALGTLIHLATADRAAIGTEGAFIADVRGSGHARAVVVITDSDVPGLVPSNARRFADPYGCPVIQVGSEARSALARAREDGRPVRVVCHATRTQVDALNVVVEIEGRDASLAPVVVITPRSGWWRCAAERGGGIVCWLETIRALAGARPARRTLFVASSGHELGHLGLDAFLHANAPLVRGAHAWIHLGANIGAGAPEAKLAGARLQASHDELDALMTATLTTANAPISDRLPRGRVPAGEARNLHTGGARYVSLLGQGNRWFHHADDRYPATVTAAAVARYARGVASAVQQLARG